MDEHFIDSVEIDSVHERPEIMTDMIPDDELMGYVTAQKVKTLTTTSIASLGSKKAQRPDNFKPIVLQNLNSEAFQYISKIFKSVLWSCQKL